MNVVLDTKEKQKFMPISQGESAHADSSFGARVQGLVKLLVATKVNQLFAFALIVASALSVVSISLYAQSSLHASTEHQAFTSPPAQRNSTWGQSLNTDKSRVLGETASLGRRPVPVSGVIQGYKVDGAGKPFSEPGATISLGGQVAGPKTNPYFMSITGSGTVTSSVPDGYAVFYSLCDNCINHPDSSYIAGASVQITLTRYGYIDLWWKYVPINDVPPTQIVTGHVDTSTPLISGWSYDSASGGAAQPVTIIAENIANTSISFKSTIKPSIQRLDVEQYLREIYGSIPIAQPLGFSVSPDNFITTPGVYKVKSVSTAAGFVLPVSNQASATFTVGTPVVPPAPLAITVLPSELRAGESYVLSATKIDSNGRSEPQTGLLDAQWEVCQSETQCSSVNITPWGDYALGGDGTVVVPLPTIFPTGTYKASFRPRGQNGWPWSNQITVKVNPPVVVNEVRGGYLDAMPTAASPHISGWSYDSAAGSTGQSVTIVVTQIDNSQTTFTKVVQPSVSREDAAAWLRQQHGVNLVVNQPLGFSVDPQSFIATPGTYKVTSVTTSGGYVIAFNPAIAQATFVIGGSPVVAPLNVKVNGTDSTQIVPGQSYNLTVDSATLNGGVDVESIVCNVDGTSCAAPIVLTPWSGVLFTAGTAAVSTTTSLPSKMYKARIRPAGKANIPWSNVFTVVVNQQASTVVKGGYIDIATNRNINGWSYDSTAGNAGQPVQIVIENTANTSQTYTITAQPTLSRTDAAAWLRQQYGANLVVNQPLGFSTDPSNSITAPGTYRVKSVTTSNGYVVEMSQAAQVSFTIGSTQTNQLTVQVGASGTTQFANTVSVQAGSSYVLSAKQGAVPYTANPRQLDYQLQVCNPQCGAVTTGPWANFALDGNGQVVVPLGSTTPGTYKAKFRPRNQTSWEWSNEVSVVVVAPAEIDPLHVPTRVMSSSLPTELGGVGGNIYAPEILYENGVYKMWYGGQAPDGSDRIHMATSTDGITWNKLGVVIDSAEATHVNDPSVVKVNGTYYMYYTDARSIAGTVLDRIYLATSTDGQNWAKQGRALDTGAQAWNNYVVGRPSVLYEAGQWKMWFDTISLDPQYPARYVGYATSSDGRAWNMRPQPVTTGGAVDVKKIGNTYFMLQEWQQGTLLLVSNDGVTWVDKGVFFGRSGTDFDQYGQVTPFLLLNPSTGKPQAVYFGGAAVATWNHNSIGIYRLNGTELDQYINQTPTVIQDGYVDVVNNRNIVGWSYNSSLGNAGQPVQIVIENTANTSQTYTITAQPTLSRTDAAAWLRQQYGANLVVNQPLGFSTDPSNSITAPGTYRVKSVTTSNGYVVEMSQAAQVSFTIGSTQTNQLTVQVGASGTTQFANTVSVQAGSSYVLSAKQGAVPYTANPRQLDYQLQVCNPQCGAVTTGPWANFALDGNGQVVVPLGSTTPGTYKAKFRPRNQTSWEWSNEVSVVVSAPVVVTPAYVKMADASAGNYGHAYGPAIVKESNVYHVFYCSQPGPNGGYGWDAIRYISSTDGVNWTNPVVKLTAWPTNVEGLTSNFAACDPNIVYFNGYYYLYYSNAHVNENGGNQTIVNIARSTTINGEYAIYTSDGTWVVGARNPKTILRPAVSLAPIPGASQAGYGAGQQTVVARGNQLYMWYTDDSEGLASPDRMRLRVSNDPVSWMDKQVHRLNVIYPGEFLNSVDVVYDQSSNVFRMVIIGRQHASGANLATSTSVNGITWTNPRVVVDAGVFPGFANNPGVERDRLGNKTSNNSFVGFGAPYDLRPNDVWGEWDLYGAVVPNLFQ